MRLYFEGINKSYGKNLALYHFSAELSPGIYALLGPNGSGKSTLMNIITDNLKADSGNILYEADSHEPKNVLEMGSRFREKIGFMPQYPGLYPNFTVKHFLEYMATLKDMGAELRGKAKQDYISQEIDHVLEAVELADIENRKINSLSGGMKQRLALAQAVLGDPEILILDEPTAGLDPKQRISVRNYISKISFNKIVIIATHVVSDIEFIANQVILLKKGVIVDMAPPKNLISKMEGKVWQIFCREEEISAWQNRFPVINTTKSEHNGMIALRILADQCPDNNAISVTPSLEDCYLYIFGNEPMTQNI